MPSGLIARVMMGRWSTQDWRRRLREAIGDIDPEVFKRRIAEVTKADATSDLARIACPLLFVSATSDRLLWSDHWKAVRKIRPEAMHEIIEGPHMLLQVKAAECAGAIKRWLHTL
jgi:pimeloyl-ACP methyl ester carboxylesterase